MTHRPLFFTLIVVLICNTQSIGQTATYEKVVQTFVEHYQTPFTGGPDVRFEKREGSYWVGYRQSREQPYTSKLFYDAPTDSFAPLDLPKASQVNVAVISNNYLAKFQKDAFRLQPFYGYEGWCYDVIAKYTNQKGLSDSALYALGRAYSTCAGDLLHNNSGLALPTQQFKISQPDGLRIDQRQKYISFSDSALFYFAKLKENNPDFLTVVGNIGLKHDLEHVASFLELLIYDNPRSAANRLKNNLFETPIKLWGKNVLDACEFESIYIANGDNDFYPLLYLQEVENYRKDVWIINYSLLQSEDYLNFIVRNPQNRFPILATNFIDGVAGIGKSYFWLDKGQGMYPQAFSKVFSEKGVDTPMVASDFMRIAAHQIALDIFGDTLRATFRREYIQRNEVVFLEFLAENYTQRNLYLSGFFNTDLMKAIEGHLLFKGLIYQISATFLPPPYTDGFASLDHAMFSAWFSNDLIWDKELLQLERFPQKWNAIRNAVFQSALRYHNQGNKAMSSTLIELALFYWPHEVLPYDWNATDLIAYYLKTNQEDKAKETATKIVKTLQSRKPKTEEALRIEAYKFDFFSRKLMELQQQYPEVELASIISSQ
ncbi:MAG: hypothetical protein LAT76_00395 [Schleiferiaceae bacterium]|nr:hypothetical protein [Schleiferiaceae bacterium]